MGKQEKKPKRKTFYFFTNDCLLQNANAVQGQDVLWKYFELKTKETRQ